MRAYGFGFGFGARHARPRAFALPGTVLYLNAGLGLDLVGGTWTDQATGVVLSKVGSPTRSSGAIGGKDALQLGAGAYFQNTTAVLIPSGAAFTVLCVAKNGNGTIFTNRRSNRYHQQQFIEISSTYYVDSDGESFNYTVADASSETQSAINAFHAVHKHNGAGNVLEVYINGTSRAVTGAAALTETGGDGFFVGHNEANQDWGGLLAELRVLGHAITAGELAQWNAYVASEYGLVSP